MLLGACHGRTPSSAALPNSTGGRGKSDQSRPLAYLFGLEFEWGEAKSTACFDQRSFDFTYAIRSFLDPKRPVEADDRYDCGVARFRVAIYPALWPLSHNFGTAGEPPRGFSLWFRFA